MTASARRPIEPISVFGQGLKGPSKVSGIQPAPAHIDVQNQHRGIKANLRIKDAYNPSMPVSLARQNVDIILGDLVTQGLLLPDPKVTTKGESEFKVDARMPEAIYHSEQGGLVRRKFYALYRERQLFVDLRLHPQRDGE